VLARVQERGVLLALALVLVGANFTSPVELFAGWDYLFFSDARPRQRVRFRAEFCTCHL